jgi:hypothetical protein
MNPLIQLKKATPLFVIPIVLACFALIVLTFVSCSSTPETISPQAFAAGEPTFTPNSYSGCNHSINVTIRSVTSGGLIWVQAVGDPVGVWISNGGNFTVNFGTGSKTLKAKHASAAHVFDSGWGYSGTYAYHCPLPTPRPRPTPHPRP